MKAPGIIIRAVIVWGVVWVTLGCDTPHSRTFFGPTQPIPVQPGPVTPVPAPPPAPASFPPISVGEVVRFQFTADDTKCVSWGWCHSYSITAPSDGRLEVAITAVSSEESFVSTTEMYVEPGPDDWVVGPGQRISVTAPVKSGLTYAIRMYSYNVPSVELELRTSLQ